MHPPPLCKILNMPVISICLVKQNDGTWVENINVFYSTFTNVFLSRFFTFFNVFYCFLERFLHLWYAVVCVSIGGNKGRLPQVGLISSNMVVAAFSIAWPIIIASNHTGQLSFLYLLTTGSTPPTGVCRYLKLVLFSV